MTSEVGGEGWEGKNGVAGKRRIILNHNIFRLFNSNSAGLTNLNKKAKTK